MPRPWARKKAFIVFTLILAITVLGFDLSLPLGVAGGVPYVALVLIALWSPWRNYIYLMAVLGTLLTIVGYFASPAGGIPWVVLTNRALAIFAIWVTAILCARIQASETTLRTTIDAAAEGIISINEQGIILSFNRVAETLFGYTLDEVIDQNVSMLMPSPDKEQHNDYIKHYLKTGERKILGIGRRVQVLHKDGYLIPVFLNVSGVQQGKQHIFTGIIRDLSKEEEKEAQLQQLWRAVEQSPISIIITDVKGNIEYANPYFSQVTGYLLAEVLGKNTRILKSGKVLPETYRQLWETISAGGVWRGTMQNRKKSGELFWESTTICPVLDQNNNITHYIALKEDITEQREKDLMLTRAMKLEAIGRMTDGIAHDFNNLLTIILGNLQLLQEDVDSEHAELVEDALSAAQDGSDLIRQMLVFSRRQKHITKPTDVNVFLGKLQRLMRRIVLEDVNMTLDLNDDSGTVLIDPNRLESAILNLVTNARDAMPEGGDLIISTSNIMFEKSEATDGGQIAPGSYIMISVTDSGTGMSEDIKQHVLEPFYSTKTSTTGTGLGLSMAHDFIVQSGGGLRIDSTPGKGTSISLLLPVCETTEDWPMEEILQSNVVVGGDETILLVEDREKVRRFASRILTRLGYHLLEAENAAEALEHLHESNDIDLLFTDIIMPGNMNGRQLARQARTLNPSLNVLLTTGMESRSDEKNNAPEEFNLLSKPYSSEQLAQTIRNILDTIN